MARLFNLYHYKDLTGCGEYLEDFFVEKTSHLDALGT